MAADQKPKVAEQRKLQAQSRTGPPDPAEAVGRVPNNVEAEQFVLGTVLLDHSMFAQVAGRLEQSDFFSNKHRRIYSCMEKLYERGDRIEYLTLRDELEKSGRLKDAGGVVYLASLTKGMPRLDSIDSYVSLVKEKSVLRRLIEVASGIIAECRNEADSVAEILDQAEKAVSGVGSQLLRKGLESPQETLANFDGGENAFLNPHLQTQGVQTPFQRFNELTNGLRGGQLVVIAGRPAMGKTAIALNIAAHVAMRQGDQPQATVALFSLEMSREALLTRLVCAEANVDQRRFRGGYIDKQQRARLRQTLPQLQASKLFIDDTANLNIIEIGAKCRRLQSEHGLHMVIVDYLQLLGSKGRTESRVQEVSGFSRGLKLLAKELDVPVVALSQLSRAPEDPRRKNARPRLSDLRDSGSIEQDADMVCFVYREEVYNPDDQSLAGKAELIIGKQRNGPTGRVKLAFQKEFAKFVMLEEREDDEDGGGYGPEPEPYPEGDYEEPPDLGTGGEDAGSGGDQPEDGGHVPF